PDLSKTMVGCSFADRCEAARSECRTSAPELTRRASGQLAACFVDGGLHTVWNRRREKQTASGRLEEELPAAPRMRSDQEAEPALAIQSLSKRFVTSGSLFRRDRRVVRAV